MQIVAFPMGRLKCRHIFILLILMYFLFVRILYYYPVRYPYITNLLMKVCANTSTQQVLLHNKIVEFWRKPDLHVKTKAQIYMLHSYAPLISNFNFTSKIVTNFLQMSQDIGLYYTVNSGFVSDLVVISAFVFATRIVQFLIYLL